MSLPARQGRSDSGPETAYRATWDAVRSRRLPAGQTLNRDQLAQQLGVAPKPLGEALPWLEAEGLLVRQSEAAWCATSLDPADIDELFELRMLLEVALVPHSIRGRRSWHVARARRLHARMSAAIQVGCARSCQRWFALNSSLHQALLAPAGSRYHPAVVDYTYGLIDPYIRLETKLTGDMLQAHSEHGEMVETFAAGDAAGFSDILRRHSDNTRERLLRQLQRG